MDSEKSDSRTSYSNSLGSDDEDIVIPMNMPINQNNGIVTTFPKCLCSKKFIICGITIYISIMITLILLCIKTN
jgi:hypothetical protein